MTGSIAAAESVSDHRKIEANMCAQKPFSLHISIEPFVTISPMLPYVARLARKMRPQAT
jgi:hypothetical protein